MIPCGDQTQDLHTLAATSSHHIPWAFLCVYTAFCAPQMVQVFRVKCSRSSSSALACASVCSLTEGTGTGGEWLQGRSGVGGAGEVLPQLQPTPTVPCGESWPEKEPRAIISTLAWLTSQEGSSSFTPREACSSFITAQPLPVLQLRALERRQKTQKWSYIKIRAAVMPKPQPCAGGTNLKHFSTPESPHDPLE